MKYHLPIISIFIIAIALAAYIFDTMSSTLIYDRDAILDGEYWRVLSGYFVHFSGLHLSFNVIAFGVTGWIIEERGYPGYSLLIFMMAFTIGVSLMVLKPDMKLYGGLSGIAHGSLVYLALFGLKESYFWNRMSWLILVFVPIKIGTEIVIGSSLAYSTETFVPIALSHLIGVVVALTQFYILQTIERQQIDELN